MAFVFPPTSSMTTAAQSWHQNHRLQALEAPKQNYSVGLSFGYFQNSHLLKKSLIILMSIKHKNHKDLQISDPEQDPANIYSGIPKEIQMNAVLEALSIDRKVDQAVAYLQKMTEASVKARSKAYGTLIDASVLSLSPFELLKALESLYKNEAIRCFGSFRLPQPPPPSLDSPSPSLSQTDEFRQEELMLGMTFLGTASLGFTLEVVDPILNQSTALPNTMLLSLSGILAVDRYLGKGDLFGKVTAGIKRLLKGDTTRECKIEAAAFLVAYLLGLPLFCFRPNVDKVLDFHTKAEMFMYDSEQPDSKAQDDTYRVVDKQVMYHKYIVWLSSGVGAEMSLDGKIIESDPSLIKKFYDGLVSLGLMEKNAVKILVLEQWAVTQASKMLEIYKEAYIGLTDKLIQGSTTGECLAYLERTVKL